MYLPLVKVCLFFEHYGDLPCNYFNKEDYRIYSMEERQEFINNDIYELDDWNKFEKAELIHFAAAWCEENQIKFTVKPEWF